MELKLVVPKKEDLWFKKEIKEDPNTMDYNAGYDLNFSGYNRENGIIRTDIKELEEVSKLTNANIPNETPSTAQEILAKPTIKEKQEEILTLRFTVRGTRNKLKELKNFLEEGGYDYE